MTIEFKLTDHAVKLSEKLNVSFIPERATKHAVGYDFKACIEDTYWLQPDEKITIHTGVHIHIGNVLNETDLLGLFSGIIIPRSSLGAKGFRLTNTIGVIDSDYQGEILLKVQNCGEVPIIINPADRVAQLLFIPCAIFDLMQVNEFSEITERGDGGFGSTGK
jgi:dUTP pyrophosphatase